MSAYFENDQSIKWFVIAFSLGLQTSKKTYFVEYLENTKGQYITVLSFFKTCLSTTSPKSQENEIAANQDTIVKVL